MICSITRRSFMRFRETDIAITGAGALDGQAGTFPNAQGVPMAWWSFMGPAGADSLRLKQQGAVPIPLGTAVTPIEERVSAAIRRLPRLWPGKPCAAVPTAR